MANKEVEMKIEVGSVFRTAKDGKTGTIVEVNDKFKTALIKMEDGKVISYSFPTLKDKRRWIPCEKNNSAPATGAEYIHEEELSDEEYAQIGLEIAEQAKQKVKTAKKQELGTGVGVDIKDYVVLIAENLGADVCESSGRFISFKINNKMFAAIFSYSKKSLTLGVRGKSIEGKTNPDSIANHMMDARFKFDTLSDNVKELIRLILESAFNYQVNLKK